MSPTSRSAVLTAGALLATLLIGFAGLLCGAKPLGLKEALAAVFEHATGTDGVIVWTLRMPRSLAAFVGGAGLAVSGHVLQTLTRNPLAAPGLTGMTAGAVAAIVACFTFLPWVSSPLYPFVGLAGGLSAAAATYWVAGRAMSPLHLALGGVAVSALLGAVTIAVLIKSAPQSPTVLFWLAGGFQRCSWPQVLLMVPWAAVGLVGAFVSHRILGLMSLGDATAAAMGLQCGRWRRALLVLAACPVAGLSPVAGPIAFVGLVVPHIVRLLRPSGEAWGVALNASVGGLLLVVADVLARSVAAPREIPVGIVTALTGGPFFVYLVTRHTPIAIRRP
ncbi:FecCD family ABC transporter permease [Methylobacterium sp. E-045]|uniref:FecCD family ABC transporter permease n=1 Tax=Methylobacterium sp. E-045 TaxID=2836575 RepID=UPI001FB9ACC5|nr:iron ABC transporter permease [Methylobacterium sp. E-045]MCJ2131716.1 iron ABC transporter permease [Methylobacterium sp. E-045]